MKSKNNLAAVFITAAALACAAAVADVTVQEQTTIQVSIVKARSTTTNRVSGDKERKDVELTCEGMMSMICGHNKSVDIVRLDRDVTWKVEPKNKRYTEIPFATAEQRRAEAAREKAAMEKLKSCPQKEKPAASSVDTSKCEMSPPVFAETKTQDVATIIGHPARRTSVSLTQSCKVKDSNDVCNMVYSLDVWLTPDELPGLGDRKSFQANLQRKLGMPAGPPVDMSELNAVLAPYAESLKQLKAKSADFKGYPLKTTFRFAIGGEHCGMAAATGGTHDNTLGNAGKAAGDATASSTESVAQSGAAEAVQRASGNSLGGYVAGSAAGAFTQNLVSGMFAKRKKPDTAAPPAAESAPSPHVAGTTTVAEISVETTSIDTAAVSPAEFEVPADYKKVTPKAADDSLPSCT
ncbi:MAG: ATP phosphoribosyltransferase regulatory subunit [Pseudomonadota bacterium]|nr:ATP phosphoribosyltransferase regulatory subunit [Pseudomonadota bacterium]